jgi:hypothetical protein
LNKIHLRAISGCPGALGAIEAFEILLLNSAALRPGS